MMVCVSSRIARPWAGDCTGPRLCFWGVSAMSGAYRAGAAGAANIEDFGSNGYVYVRGDLQRYQTKRVRTILPTPAESNAAFELRMHGLALQLLTRPEIHSVAMDIEMMNGADVKCTVTIVEAPRPAPIAPDERPAGGRFSARGQRGGGR